MSKSAYIYVLGTCEQFGVVKIGKSNRPASNGRIQSLQTGNPNLLMLWGEVAVPSVRVLHIEREIHKSLSDALVRGEWFKIHPKDALEKVREISEKFVNPVNTGIKYEKYCHAAEIKKLIDSGSIKVAERIGEF